MVSEKSFREMALSFPEVYEQGHFEKTSFRVGKKIFATLDASNKQACLKLSLADQDVFCTYDKTIIFQVPNKWGTLGWTNINLEKIPKKMLLDALSTAYCEVAPKKLAALITKPAGKFF